MAILADIGFWGLLVYAAITSCYLSKRYKDLRNYTFWVEQSLLQHRPETYIPVWRKQQREKDICKKTRPCRDNVQTVVTAGSKTTECVGTNHVR